MCSSLIVQLYRYWHGKLGFKGAGLLLRVMSRILPSLRFYRLTVDEIGYVYVDFSDESAYQWMNCSLGERGQEDGLLKAVSRFLEKSDVVWDIGANAGLFTAHIACHEHSVKRIHAFEPNPSLFRLLEATFKSNESVTLHNVALSSSSAKVAMHIPRGDSCLGSVEGVNEERRGKRCFVQAVRADQMLDEGVISLPDVVKIDVEGHERDVLQGMSEAIVNARPVIFVEHIFSDLDEFKGLMPDDYEIYTVSDDSGDLIKGSDRSLGHNSALIPNELIMGL